MRLLIVDDEKIICDGLRTLVGRLEIAEITSIRTAYRAETAIEIARDEVPDILITDVRMPGKSGLDLISEMRALNAGLQSIVLTGHDDFELVRTALRLEALDYLLKPASKEELRSVIRRALAEIETARERVRSSQSDRAGQFDAIVDAAWPWFVEGAELTRETIAYLDHTLVDRIAAPYLAILVVEHAMHDPLGLGVDLLTELYGRPELAPVWRLRPLSQTAALAVVAAAAADTIADRLGAIETIVGAPRYRDLHVSTSHVRKGIGSLPVLFGGCRIARTGKLLDARQVHRYEPLPHPDSAHEGSEATLRPLVATIERLASVDDASESDRATAERRLADALGSGQQPFVVWDQIVHMVRAAGKLDEPPPGIEEYFSVRSLLERLIEVSRGIEGEPSASTSHPIVRRAMQYAARNFRNQHAVRDVAEAMGLSYAYFSTLFKQETGASYTHYLLGLRMAEARRMLEEGVFTVGDIAARVGYLYPKHFTRAFRNHHGVSPSDYARRSSV